jgi:hypothetical protein
LTVQEYYHRVTPIFFILQESINPMFILFLLILLQLMDWVLLILEIAKKLRFGRKNFGFWILSFGFWFLDFAHFNFPFVIPSTLFLG